MRAPLLHGVARMKGGEGGGEGEKGVRWSMWEVPTGNILEYTGEGKGEVGQRRTERKEK